jgi:hypothetical protein
MRRYTIGLAVALFALAMMPAAPDAVAPSTSPYLVHDTEIMFWHMVKDMNASDGIFKYGLDFSVTRFGIGAAAYLEVPLTADYDFGTPYAERIADRSIFSFFVGAAVQSFSNGDPDLAPFAVSPSEYELERLNTSRWGIAGIGFYSQWAVVRIGALLYGYALSPYIYHDGVETSDPGYFNYVPHGYDEYRLGARPYLDLQVPFRTVVLGLLHAIDQDDLTRTAYTRASLDLDLPLRAGVVTPYASVSSDTIGREELSVRQYGINGLLLLRTYERANDVTVRRFLRMEANYTDADETDLARGKKDTYGFVEYFHDVIGISTWASSDAGLWGVGVSTGAYFMLPERGNVMHKIELRVSYNPFVPYPLYQRTIVEGGLSFQFVGSFVL